MFDSGIPYLHSHQTVVHLNFLRKKISSNSRLVLIRELLAYILVHQRGLSNTIISKEAFTNETRNEKRKRKHKKTKKQKKINGAERSGAERQKKKRRRGKTFVSYSLSFLFKESFQRKSERRKRRKRAFRFVVTEFQKKVRGRNGRKVKV